MKSYLRIVLLLLLLFNFESCSWQEYFIIINQSNREQKIIISLDEIQEGIPIFDRNFDFYEFDKAGNPLWDKKKTLRVVKLTDYSFEFNLPIGYGVVFGRLSNDKYISSNQNFINGRRFNLQSIETDHEEVLIVKENFDRFFIKSNGHISYQLK